MPDFRLVRYDAARHALRVATQVDDVKDIRDKALALAAYAKQAQDTEMFKWVNEIKLRAERRTGELLSETERAKGGRPAWDTTPSREEILTSQNPPPSRGVSDDPKSLKDIGLTEQQSSDFQAIATIPQEQFEAELANGDATTKSLVRVAKGEPKLPTVAEDAYKKLLAEYNDLRENRDALADELAAVESYRTNDHVLQVKQLLEELRACRRARDDAMNKANDAIRQVKYWRDQAEKLGWKPRERKA